MDKIKMDWDKTNKILDAILKVGKIICMPVGIYLTYLGAFAKRTPEVSKMPPWMAPIPPAPINEPDWVTLAAGLGLVIIGTFFVTRMWRKK
ncbi:MAG: hypothetical protein EHM49_03300 [Deltaproteobacteria bacterium]|nr:MAG: hypothetical protein EHM49_03300 [Deltaproteobacteria bacterium]